MAKQSKQDKKIFDYITDLRSRNKKIPFMTKISKDTGVSVATISRYASKKGFSNFAVLRDKYNSGAGNFRTTSTRMKELISFIRRSEELYIIPSQSCYSLGYHLHDRLTKLKYKSGLRDKVSAQPEEFEKIPRNASVIFVTLSTNTAWYERYIKHMIPNRGMVVTTKKATKVARHVKQIIHTDMGAIKPTDLEFGVARSKVMAWLDSTITQLHIELLDEKKA